jgi:D-sedoheptulose 7-phosphate isomerase
MGRPDALAPRAEGFLGGLGERRPELTDCLPSLGRAARVVAGCFRRGGRVYLCGNGGSHADCEHIAGELVKAFVGRRQLSAARRKALEAAGPDGGFLAGSLQAGLPAMVLGANGAVATAIANDLAAEVGFAQELEAFGRAGDVLVAVSTSGRSRNVVLAAQVARSLEMSVICLTGPSGLGAPLGSLADVVVAVPASAAASLAEVQELHTPLYHALCGAIEAELFGS